MGISRWGTRLDQKVQEAEARAEQLAREREEYLANPANLVTEKALEFETYEKVAEQLARAFGQTLTKLAKSARDAALQAATSPNDWYEAGTGVPSHDNYAVYCRPDFQAMTYWLKVDRNKTSVRRYVITEETLAKNTETVEIFHAWVAAVAMRLRSLSTNMLSALHDDALEELEAFGVKYVPEDQEMPSRLEDPEEAERKAIESILRAGSHGS